METVTRTLTTVQCIAACKQDIGHVGIGGPFYANTFFHDIESAMAWLVEIRIELAQKGIEDPYIMIYANYRIHTCFGYTTTIKGTCETLFLQDTSIVQSKLWYIWINLFSIHGF